MSDPGRPPPPVVVSLAGLTVVSGMLDAVSFLALGHVFTANMTGNIVLLGFALAGAPGLTATAHLTALASFALGAVLAGRVIKRRPPPRDLMLLFLGLETTLTVTAALVAASVATVGSGWPRFLLITLLGLGVGARNAAVRSLRVADMTTTVITTTLTGLAMDSSLAGGTNPNAAHRATSVVTMFVGALVGAVLVIHVGAAWSLGVDAIVVAVTAAFFFRQVPASFGLAR